jgi:hypothetical protein
MEENTIPKRVLYMNLGTTRLRGRPRNRRQDEVREDGRIVGGEGWQEKVHNREEWKEAPENGNESYSAQEVSLLCISPLKSFMYFSSPLMPYAQPI